MTPFEAAGFSDKQLVISYHHFLASGTYIRLIYDDGSHMPKFAVISGKFKDEEYWIPLDCIESFDQSDALKNHITAIAKLQNKDEIDVVGALIEAEIIVDEQADELSRWFGGLNVHTIIRG